MPKSMRVQIDSAGHIHPLEPATGIPEGNAILTWPDGDDPSLTLLLSEASFAAELFNEEEDAAWAYLQSAK